MTDMLFDTLEIRQFRAFDFLKVERLGNVNLFLGKNNVGKSTLLEALWLYANIGSPEIVQTILQWRDEPGEIRHGKTAEPMIWRLFHGHSPLDRITSSIQIGRMGAPDSALTLSIVWDAGMKRSEISDADGLSDMDGRVPSLVVKQGSFQRRLDLDEAFDDICRRWNLQARNARDLMTPCIFFGPNGLDENAMQVLWENIVLTDAKADVIDAMRIIAPETEDFALLRFHTPASSIRLRLRGEDAPVPLKSMGDGMNRLFGLGMALACSKDGILLIDEIENGIHWTVLPEVWKFIVKVAKRLNVQVFATTHSHDCLKAFHFGTRGDQAVEGVAIRIEKKNDEFKTEIFDETRLEMIVRENIEIR